MSAVTENVLAAVDNTPTAEDFEEVKGRVEEMKAPGTFNLLAAIEGTQYPVGEETVFTNGKAAEELNDLLEEEARLQHEHKDDMTGVPNQEEIDQRKEVLVKEVLASALTFHMRGLAPKVIELMAKEARRKFPVKGKSEEEVYELNEDADEWITNEMIAKCIVKVVNANGDEDTTSYRNEDVGQLRDFLHRVEFNKLDKLAGKLNGSKALFDNALDADFLQKS